MVLVYAVLGALVLVLAGGAVAEHTALDEPVRWGLFRMTDRDCSTGRGGETCTPIGTWTADDGSASFDRVALDDRGWDPDGLPTGDVRAGFREFDTDDGVPDTVYEPDEVDLVWTGPAVAALVVLGMLLALAFRWGDAGRIWRVVRARAERRPGAS